MRASVNSDTHQAWDSYVSRSIRNLSKTTIPGPWKTGPHEVKSPLVGTVSRRWVWQIRHTRPTESGARRDKIRASWESFPQASLLSIKTKASYC
jgi:hypothetical protein